MSSGCKQHDFIYIPICFYLNICSNNLTIFNAVTICFYLNVGAFDRIELPLVIYIPICFYLNQINTKIRIKRDNIYIPICFYLNAEPAIVYDAKLSNLHSNMLLFKQPYKAVLGCFFDHLHSNMLLFKFFMRTHRNKTIVIYIPICFYLNLNSIPECHLKYTFTFQYASI